MKIIIFCILLLLTNVLSARSQGDLKNNVEVGQQSPAFEIVDLDGNEFNLSNHKGKVVFVFFWTTWCPYCQAEMPYLEKEVWNKFKSEDFVMLGIAREETNQQISNYKRKAKFTFPIAADLNGETFDLFADGGVPRSYVIGRNGKILFQTIGLSPEEFAARNKAIEKELKAIKKEKTKE